MKKILIITFLCCCVISSFADNYSVVTYHQPGIFEAIGRTAVGLTAVVGSTAVGLTQAVGKTAVGLIRGYDQTVVIPNRQQVIFQSSTPVYYSYPAPGTQVIIRPGDSSYKTYTTSSAVYTVETAAPYVEDDAYYAIY